MANLGLGARVASSRWVRKSAASLLIPASALSRPCHLAPPIREPGPPSRPSPQPLQSRSHAAPPPRRSAVASLAPLPALYSCKLAPHSCSTPVRPPTQYNRFLEKCAPPWPNHSRQAGKGSGQAPLPLPRRSPCERRGRSRLAGRPRAGREGGGGFRESPRLALSRGQGSHSACPGEGKLLTWPSPRLLTFFSAGRGRSVPGRGNRGNREAALGEPER